MRTWLCGTIVFLFLYSVHPLAAAERPKVVAYVPNWIDLQAYSQKIDYAQLTHINLAFENPTSDDGDLSFHAKDDLIIRQAREHGVKILVSIGGGSAATNATLKPRYFRLISTAKRADFVKKLAAYVAVHQLDGLDVDIEGPSINADYGPFVEALSTALHAQHKLLSAALSQGYGGKSVPDAALKQFDFVNIMAYDAAGPWKPNSPGQPSSFEFSQKCVAYWLKRGLPNANAVLGIPFYGYDFGASGGAKSVPFSQIVKAQPDAAQKDQIGDKLFYNGIPTIKKKAQSVLDQKLGGVMIWSLNDDAAGDDSLLKAIAETLAPQPAPRPAK
ncbi:MAG TPA: glycosyl hydrolase family 18 protein [Pirellulales bacterium]|jgi:GH18 family chitinase|nr:glycosyl hydrolase family 18 protein [Pirellulales bacterium]